jgi:4-diphosphocytidyl-2C-methyl-D-erythritol kinase
MKQDYVEKKEHLEELEVLNDNLTMERDEMVERMEVMEEKVSELAGSVEAHQAALETFGELFEALGGSGTVAPALAKKGKKAAKSVKNNILNVSHSPRA